MSRPEVRVVVLYEDEQHSKLVRQLTRKLGLRPEYFVRCGGCGDVIRRFEQELLAMRPRMSFQKNLGLLVVIDADDRTVTPRLKQLEAVVAASNTGGPRGPAERIAYLIPALEIENWYVHLCVPAARPIDEGHDYKPDAVWRELAKELGKAAKAAVDAWDPQPNREDPASLVTARQELTRL